MTEVVNLLNERLAMTVRGTTGTVGVGKVMNEFAQPVKRPSGHSYICISRGRAQLECRCECLYLPGADGMNGEGEGAEVRTQATPQ